MGGLSVAEEVIASSQSGLNMARLATFEPFDCSSTNKQQRFYSRS